MRVLGEPFSHHKAKRTGHSRDASVTCWRMGAKPREPRKHPERIAQRRDGLACVGRSRAPAASSRRGRKATATSRKRCKIDGAKRSQLQPALNDRRRRLTERSGVDLGRMEFSAGAGWLFCRVETCVTGDDAGAPVLLRLPGGRALLGHWKPCPALVSENHPIKTMHCIGCKTGPQKMYQT